MFAWDLPQGCGVNQKPSTPFTLLSKSPPFKCLHFSSDLNWHGVCSKRKQSDCQAERKNYETWHMTVGLKKNWGLGESNVWLVMKMEPWLLPDYKMLVQLAMASLALTIGIRLGQDVEASANLHRAWGAWRSYISPPTPRMFWKKAPKASGAPPLSRQLAFSTQPFSEQKPPCPTPTTLRKTCVGTKRGYSVGACHKN